MPWTLIIFLAALTLPWIGSRYDTFLGTQIAIYALFAVSLNLLLGTTGLVSFGHAAYFGIGSYVCGILMKTLRGAVLGSPFRRPGLIAALFALVFGFFCVRLTKIYFAMLTLAFAQIVWAICFKWNDVTGGDQGLPDVPFPTSAGWRRCPASAHLRIGEQFYVLALTLVALCIAALRRLTASPFGRVLTTIRENPERAAFIGVNVRAYELAAFTIAGGFAGLSGALFGIFNRGVFADFVFWSKSADVMIMTILGGMHHFWGPAVGALVLTLLNQQITAYTEYWPFVLGTILVVLLFVFPGGILGALDVALSRVCEAARCLRFRGLTQVVSPALSRSPTCRSRVETRQIAAVIGPNGAGKSTLFNLITGHLRPDSGRVLLDGRDITGVQPHETCRMGLGRSFQRTNIFPKLTVFREPAGGVPGASTGAAAISGRAPTRCTATRSRRCSVSIGLRDQAQRARRHARATATRSSSNWAWRWPATRRCCCSTSRPPACRRARRTRRSGCWSASPSERGLTLLFTEHDMEVVFGIAQKIAVLHQGRLIADGAPAEVRNDPEVRRVYLGHACIAMTRCSRSRISTAPTG